RGPGDRPQLRKRGHQGGLPPGGEAPGLARGTATGSCGDECPPARACGAVLLLDFVPATARIRLDTAPPLHEKRGAAPEPTGSRRRRGREAPAAKSRRRPSPTGRRPGDIRRRGLPAAASPV